MKKKLTQDDTLEWTLLKLSTVEMEKKKILYLDVLSTCWFSHHIFCIILFKFRLCCFHVLIYILPLCFPALVLMLILILIIMLICQLIMRLMSPYLPVKPAERLHTMTCPFLFSLTPSIGLCIQFGFIFVQYYFP